MEFAERRLFEGIMYQFWNSWKEITELEEKAIRSLKSARKIILDNVPRNKIVAIYVGGSFVRREMNEKSDVDTWTIVKESRLVKKLESLHKEWRYQFKPEIGISGYSLWELMKGKSRGEKPKVNPQKFLTKIDNYALIFGRPINKNNYLLRNEIDELKRSIKFHKNKLIPEYEKTKSGFSVIVKQTFWLADLEQRCKGEDPPYSWKILVHSITDKKHIIHDAWHYRQHPTKNERKREAYLRKPKKYISQLEVEL